MSNLQLKLIDEGVFNLLSTIRKSPSLYIGTRSLIRLHAFLGGYQCGLGKLGGALRQQDEFQSFHDWVAKQLNFVESTSGWCNMILAKTENDEKAYYRFFELLDQFCEEKRIIQ